MSTYSPSQLPIRKLPVTDMAATTVREPGLDGRGIELVAITIAFTVLATLFVVMRMVVRLRLRSIWIDDYIILASLVS